MITIFLNGIVLCALSGISYLVNISIVGLIASAQ